MRIRIPLLAVLFLLVSAPGASACSCVQFDPAWIEEHDAAIVGTVVHVREASLMSRSKVTQVLVERTRDGEVEVGDVIGVRSGSGGGDCGLELEVGDRAGLLLQRSGDLWTGSLCTTTSAEQLATELDRHQPLGGASASLESFVTSLLARIQTRGFPVDDWDPCPPVPVRRRAR